MDKELDSSMPGADLFRQLVLQGDGALDAGAARRRRLPGDARGFSQHRKPQDSSVYRTHQLSQRANVANAAT